MPETSVKKTDELIVSHFNIQIENKFDFQSSDFHDLFKKSNATAFQNPVWLHELYQKIAPNRNAHPVIITGRLPEKQELVFVLPMTIRRVNGVQLLESADLGVSDYSAPIVDKNMVDLMKEDHLPTIIDKVIGKYDILRLKPIREQTLSLWSLFFSGEYEKLNFSSHEMQIGSSFKEWREETYNSKFRKEIDRKSRSFNRKANLRFELLTDDDAVETVENIQKLRTGRFEGDPIQQDFVLSFYKKIAKIGSNEGFAHVHKLSADGELVGALFGLSRNGTHHGILMGADYDRFSKYSPTMLMIDQLLKNWHENGGTIADFNIGDEPFKRRFGTKSVNLYQLCRPKSPIGWLAKKALELKDR
ncbi:GNAT family N-acetyltransferase [Lentilitoribacter sp. Alg239-R112]|uniref:GNAT family N-acetyltransferase n=1 Tax=Lentilitoribacter sp. Alg239-R112 TaxID=2305987 RepID=UPI0013A6DB9C|nr:GNAT family N-acetyltransferase [Lentilitoribacter sp. Alg239-R112]